MSLATRYVIRDVQTYERAAVRDLTLAAYEQYATLLTPTHWQGLRGAIVAALDATGPVERIVAAQGNELIGSVMLCPPAEATGDRALGRMIWPELRLLAVAPQARGRGVGQALVAECLRRAAHTGAEALGLYTSDDLVAAVRLYERMGFVRVPHYDFRAGGGELVKAYQHDLRG
jgi:ribosomal protein S18 acetylase RimI-like enzyme